MAYENDCPKRLAILIDAENVSARLAQAIFDEVATIGEANVRRIYGDFSNNLLKGWSQTLKTHAILPCQSFPNTAGKNAADIALLIDAMDLLHSGRFDGFCLVSSDSDFTRLAARIREHGLDVYGFGERKTPESFRRACKRFIYIENLICADEALSPAKSDPGGGLTHATSAKLPPSAAIATVIHALGQMDDADGWYFLGALGARLAALMPDFDPRTYGCTKLMTLIERSEAFDVRRDRLKVYIRPKPNGLELPKPRA